MTESIGIVDLSVAHITGTEYLRVLDTRDNSLHRLEGLSVYRGSPVPCFHVRYNRDNWDCFYTSGEPYYKGNPLKIVVIPIDEPQVFYLVWRSDGKNPKRRHRFEHEAKAEAERLAKENLGVSFFVLKAVSESKSAEPAVTTKTLV